MGLLDRVMPGRVDWSVELARPTLLPGQVAEGRVTFTPEHQVEARGVIAALVATEQWQYHETTNNGRQTTTRTVTRTAELQRLPVQLCGPATFEAGQPVTFDLQLPVPPLGPASFLATVTRLSWEVQVKIDAPGPDRSTAEAVTVLQPTALLRAGVVHVGEFALYESAAGLSDVGGYTIALRPMPLCVGQPFTGELTFGGAPPSKLQGVRAELRVEARATVANGLSESIVLWTAPLAVGTEMTASYALSGSLPETYLPTIELPHGSARAVFDVILDRRMARDAHLRRDVTVCSTTEV